MERVREREKERSERGMIVVRYQSEVMPSMECWKPETPSSLQKTSRISEGRANFFGRPGQFFPLVKKLFHCFSIKQ